MSWLDGVNNSDGWFMSRRHHYNGHINILDYNTTDSSLTLASDVNNDAGWLEVQATNKVKWVIKKPGLIINEIAVDPNYSNDPGFFSNLPHLQPSGWEATIGDPRSVNLKGYVEKYYIQWSLAAHPSKKYIYDPLMQINPKGLKYDDSTTLKQ